MPVKLGNGGHSQENYDPNTGKYSEDGIPNKRYDNPNEKLFNSMGIKNTDTITEYKIPNVKSDDPYVAQDLKKVSFEKFIDTRERAYRYREWIDNSNSDYKRYIYNDLKNEKKEAALNFWYNDYKLKTGNYKLSFEDFLNTPIILYRATNIDEENDEANPFFSYSPLRSDAERFLDISQNSYLNRSGEIKEIKIRPIDTFGMLPGQELEVVIPNPNYQKLEEKAEQILKEASSVGANFPYDKNDLINLYIGRKEKKLREDFEQRIKNLIYKGRPK